MSDKFKKYAEQSLKEASERKKNKSPIKKKEINGVLADIYCRYKLLF